MQQSVLYVVLNVMIHDFRFTSLGTNLGLAWFCTMDGNNLSSSSINVI